MPSQTSASGENGLHTVYPDSMPVIEAMYEQDAVRLLGTTVQHPFYAKSLEEQPDTVAYIRSMVALKSAIRSVAAIPYEHARSQFSGDIFYGLSGNKIPVLTRSMGEVASEATDLRVVDDSDYVVRPNGVAMSGTIGKDAVLKIVEGKEVDEDLLSEGVAVRATSSGDSSPHAELYLSFPNSTANYFAQLSTLDFVRKATIDPLDDSLRFRVDQEGVEVETTKSDVVLVSAIASYAARFLMYPARHDAERFSELPASFFEDR